MDINRNIIKLKEDGNNDVLLFDDGREKPYIPLRGKDCFIFLEFISKTLGNLSNVESLKLKIENEIIELKKTENSLSIDEVLNCMAFDCDSKYVLRSCISLALKNSYNASSESVKLIKVCFDLTEDEINQLNLSSMLIVLTSIIVKNYDTIKKAFCCECVN